MMNNMLSNAIGKRKPSVSGGNDNTSNNGGSCCNSARAGSNMRNGRRTSSQANIHEKNYIRNML